MRIVQERLGGIEREIIPNHTLIMKKVTSETFANITRPLKEEAKRVGFKESDVVRLVHNLGMCKSWAS